MRLTHTFQSSSVVLLRRPGAGALASVSDSLLLWAASSALKSVFTAGSALVGDCQRSWQVQFQAW